MILILFQSPDKSIISPQKIKSQPNRIFVFLNDNNRIIGIYKKHDSFYFIKYSIYLILIRIKFYRLYLKRTKFYGKIKLYAATILDILLWRKNEKEKGLYTIFIHIRFNTRNTPTARKHPPHARKIHHCCRF